jgi:hypothetical protein
MLSCMLRVLQGVVLRAACATECCTSCCVSYRVLYFMLCVLQDVVLHAVCATGCYASFCVSYRVLCFMLCVLQGVVLHAVCATGCFTSCCVCHRVLCFMHVDPFSAAMCRTGCCPSCIWTPSLQLCPACFIHLVIGLSTWRLFFNPSPSMRQFMMDTVALCQVFLPLLRFLLLVSFHQRCTLVFISNRRCLIIVADSVVKQRACSFAMQTLYCACAVCLL